MVQIEDMTKQLGNFKLEHITMQFPAGYIMGLIGPNGAGKTTLLHLLLGLYTPEEGSIRIAGKAYGEKEQEIHDGIGTVLQERLFEDYRTLEENGAYYGKYYSNYNKEQFRAYLTRFGLKPEKKYKGLSKGEELKFQFAFALAHAPRLLLLDEPTGNFDPEFREEFLGILKEFIANGKNGVILATHLTQDLDRLADYITYLEKGKMLFSMDVESMKDKFRLVSGENYKVKLLPKEYVIHMEQGAYGTKALVRHMRRLTYEGLHVARPTIEELMYFITKREKGTVI